MTETTSPAPQSAAETGGIKDTIESILIAFILAFVFRAFVVEAFVIPTGSMAPTLLGAHMRYTCEDCGYSFTVNYSSRSIGEDIVIPRSAGPSPNRAVFCPNCGFQLRPSQTFDPPVHYGDRILVLKYSYLLNPPQRWDVVVFKNPDDQTGEYTTNYIKRLIGRPGESVMVLDGDVYVGPKDATDPKDFHIQAKPRYAQDALWRIVYDNDYYPRKLDRGGHHPWRNPWTAESAAGWDLGHDAVTGRTFHFDNLSAASAIHFDPEANFTTHSLTDWLAYDQNEGISDPITAVSDLKLSLFYTRQEGEGPLRLTLSRQETIFTAELTPTGVRLLKRVGDGAETEIGTAPLSLPAGKSVQIEFTNVDYRVALRIDDRDVIVTTPEQYAPDVAKLIADYPAYHRNSLYYGRPTIRIEAARQRAAFEHVSLARDIYYTNYRSELRWAIPRDFPQNVVRLSDTPGKEEYFVMGDNSLVSGDARFWGRTIDLPAEDLYVEGGRVPSRFMLGKAFFVYWPAGFRPQANLPGLIPNFGQMRFIH